MSAKVNAYEEGALAAKRGQAVIDNPHTGLSLASGNKWKLWRDGFRAALGMEARSVETEGLDPKDDSPTAKPGAQRNPHD